MIEQEMKFHGPFGTSELRPGKQRQAEGYGGAVQGKQFVLEPEFVRPGACTLTHSKGVVEEIPK